jgi:hypothetical protein
MHHRTRRRAYPAIQSIFFLLVAHISPEYESGVTRSRRRNDAHATQCGTQLTLKEERLRRDVVERRPN